MTVKYKVYINSIYLLIEKFPIFNYSGYKSQSLCHPSTFKHITINNTNIKHKNILFKNLYKILNMEKYLVQKEKYHVIKVKIPKNNSHTSIVKLSVLIY